MKPYLRQQTGPQFTTCLNCNKFKQLMKNMLWKLSLCVMAINVSVIAKSSRKNASNTAQFNVLSNE